MKFQRRSCAGCASIATCKEAERIGVFEISRGHSCSLWEEATSPTLEARKELIQSLGPVGLKAVLTIPTIAIHSGDMMSDREERVEELEGMSRPQRKTALYSFLSELEGKELQAALKLYNPETKWSSDDATALKEAKRAGIRTKPERLLEVLLALEFPDAPAKKTRGGRKAKKEEPEEEEEEAPKKPARRRRRTKQEMAEAKAAEAAESAGGGTVDVEALVDALIEKIGPSLNGLADAVEALQKDVTALKGGQTVLAIAGVDEDIKDHDDVLAFLEEG
jgi:hypothetical protein